MYERLARLSGSEFDREFMRHQVKMHDEAVSLFDRQVGGGKDADLKAFAARTLPTLREHQQMARDVAAKAGALAKAENKAWNNSCVTSGAGLFRALRSVR
jgi:predicted outer membrane protein